MKELFLVGAGSGSREILLLIDRINQKSPEWNVLGFIDEDPRLVGTEIDGVPVFGPDNEFRGPHFYGTSGVQEPAVRQRLLENYVEARGCLLATLLAPDLVIPRDFATGPGTVIMPGVTVSFDVQLGKGVLVLWNATLGHELRVGPYSTILTCALITGGCKIGSRATIGAGAILNIRARVGDDALVGVGTAIFSDVADRRRVVAFPQLMNLGEQT